MGLWMVIALLALALPLRAEMAGDDYQSDAGALSAEEREAARRRLAAQIAAERARAEETARQAQLEAEELSRALATRPLGAQLLEARCLTCHDRAQIDAARFGTLGWNMTVLRMQLLNGADLRRGERGAIVGYLVARDPGRNRLEWGLAGLTLLALIGIGIGLKRSTWWRA